LKSIDVTNLGSEKTFIHGLPSYSGDISFQGNKVTIFHEIDPFKFLLQEQSILDLMKIIQEKVKSR